MVHIRSMASIMFFFLFSLNISYCFWLIVLLTYQEQAAAHICTLYCTIIFSPTPPPHKLFCLELLVTKIGTCVFYELSILEINQIKHTVRMQYTKKLLKFLDQPSLPPPPAPPVLAT